MNNKTMEAILAAASVALASASFAATPEVTGGTMTQATSSRLVTIEYTLADAPAVVTLDVQTNANTSAAADDPGWTSIGGAAVANAQGDVWKKVALDLTEGNSFNGTITWRPDLSWPDHKVADGGARAVVTAWALDNTPDYMVVDITSTAATNSQCYYPSADHLPGGLLSNQNYRQTKMVMRKIMAKDVEWTMGSTRLESNRQADETTHQVKLANNFYIAVFEVTQAQWVQIIEELWSQIPERWHNPSKFREDGAMRPVTGFAGGDARTGLADAYDSTYDWPADPNPNSFLGLLRKKTGIDFDLPSEAQWEFAARAGNGDMKWGDGTSIGNSDEDSNLNLLGRYQRNGGRTWNGSSYVDYPNTVGPTNGTAIVGSYVPNAWGLYDMFGNAGEWCLDWYQADITANGGNVVTVNSTNKRVVRGGYYSSPAGNCRPAYRDSNGLDGSSRWAQYGIRVVCTAGLQ